MIAGYLLAGECSASKKVEETLGCFEKIYVSVEKPMHPEREGMPAVVDEKPERGVLGKLYDGLRLCEEEELFVAAGDMYFVTPKAVRRLLDVYSHRQKITIAWAQEEEQPLLGIYPKSALPMLEKQLEAGDYELMHALVNAGYAVVTLPKETEDTIS